MSCFIQRINHYPHLNNTASSDWIYNNGSFPRRLNAFNEPHTKLRLTKINKRANTRIIMRTERRNAISTPRTLVFRRKRSALGKNTPGEMTAVRGFQTKKKRSASAANF